MKKKIISILICFNLIVCSFFSSYVQAYAGAADIIAGAGVVLGGMSQGDAMALLMEFFGISPSAAALAAAGGVGLWGVQQVEKYKQYMGAKSEYESEAEANQAALDLLDGITTGVLNTGSKAYDYFKEWLQSLSSSGDFDSVPTPLFRAVEPNEEIYVFYNGHTFIPRKSSDTFNMYCYFYNNVYHNVYFRTFQGAPVSGIPLSNTLSFDNVLYYYGESTYSSPYKFISSSCPLVDFSGTVANSLSFVLSGLVSESDYDVSPDLLSGLQERDKTLEDMEQQGISSTGEISTTGTGERGLTVDNSLEKTGSSSIEKLLEKVYSGEISWSDFMDAIGVSSTVGTVEGTKVITIERDKTVSFENEENKKSNQDMLPDVTDLPSYNNEDFTIQNLEAIFPFCIPFDLLDFIRVLDADPVAPRWVVSASFIGFENESFVIDLSKWDALAEICRDGEILLYIFGLILLTRNIIRG